MFDGYFRTRVNKIADPAGAWLRKIGISANTLTFLGIAAAAVAMWAVATGRLILGFILVVATGLCDLLDGPVAKAAQSSSTRGAFFDSVADRATDIMLLCGIAWHLNANDEGGNIYMLAIAVMAVSQIVSYQRAKAEALGLTGKGGIMERAERFVALAAGLLFEVILVPILWILLVLVSFTAWQRFIHIWRQAARDSKNL